MKNLEANDGKSSARTRGFKPLHQVNRPRLALLAVASLFGSIFLAGCAADGPKGGKELSDLEFRILYPRQYYYTAGSWTRDMMDMEDALSSRRSK